MWYRLFDVNAETYYNYSDEVGGYWYEYCTADGIWYYYNSETGESAWTLPLVNAAPPQQPYGTNIVSDAGGYDMSTNTANENYSQQNIFEKSPEMISTPEATKDSVNVKPQSQTSVTIPGSYTDYADFVKYEVVNSGREDKTKLVLSSRVNDTSPTPKLSPRNGDMNDTDEKDPLTQKLATPAEDVIEKDHLQEKSATLVEKVIEKDHFPETSAISVEKTIENIPLASNPGTDDSIKQVVDEACHASTNKSSTQSTEPVTSSDEVDTQQTPQITNLKMDATSSPRSMDETLATATDDGHRLVAVAEPLKSKIDDPSENPKKTNPDVKPIVDAPKKDNTTEENKLAEETPATITTESNQIPNEKRFCKDPVAIQAEIYHDEPSVKKDTTREIEDMEETTTSTTTKLTESPIDEASLPTSTTTTNSEGVSLSPEQPKMAQKTPVAFSRITEFTEVAEVKFKDPHQVFYLLKEIAGVAESNKISRSQLLAMMVMNPTARDVMKQNGFTLFTKPRYFNFQFKNIDRQHRNFLAEDDIVLLWQQTRPYLAKKTLIPYEERMRRKATKSAKDPFSTASYIVVRVPATLQDRVESILSRKPYCWKTRRELWNKQMLKRNQEHIEEKSRLESQLQELEETARIRLPPKLQSDTSRTLSNERLIEATGEEEIERMESFVSNKSRSSRSNCEKSTHEEDSKSVAHSDVGNKSTVPEVESLDEAVFDPAYQTQLEELRYLIETCESVFLRDSSNLQSTEDSLRMYEDEAIENADSERKTFLKLMSSVTGNNFFRRLQLQHTIREEQPNACAVYLVRDIVRNKRLQLRVYTAPHSMAKSMESICTQLAEQKAPNIVKLEYFSCDSLKTWSRLFWLQEDYPQGCLTDILDYLYKKKPISRYVDEIRVLACAFDISHAIQSLHKQGLVHGSIHSMCIFINNKHFLLGMPEDFVSMVESHESRLDEYSAPESASCKTLNTRQACDMWSIGAIVYHLATGRMVERGASVATLVNDPILKRYQRWIRSFLKMTLAKSQDERVDAPTLCKFMIECNDSVRMAHEEEIYLRGRQ